MSSYDDRIDQFKDKVTFIINPTLTKQWIVEVWNSDEILTGRVIVENKAGLLHALEEAIEEDTSFDIDVDGN
jgi:hypothetical protein